MGGLPCGPPLARMSRFRYAGMCSPPVRGSDDAFPSVETARLHHAPRRCGARMAARPARAGCPPTEGRHRLSRTGGHVRPARRVVSERTARGRIWRPRADRAGAVTGGDPARTVPLAAEVVERNVDVILAISSVMVKAFRDATRTIPIVALDLETDPVGSGLIASVAHPGGNITGLFFDFPDFTKKWLELLREAIPQLSRIAVLWDPATAATPRKAVEQAAGSLSIQVDIFEVRT